MLTHEQIAAMTPDEAWRELESYCAVLPLLMTRAQGTGEDEEWLTAAEVARRLAVSESAVRMRAASDPRWEKFSKKVGKSWRFKRHEFERYVNESRSREL